MTVLLLTLFGSAITMKQADLETDPSKFFA